MGIQRQTDRVRRLRGSKLKAPICQVWFNLKHMKILWFFCFIPILATGAVSGVTVSGLTNTQAILSYTAPDANPCQVEISESATYSPLVHDVDAAKFSGANYDNRPGSITNGRSRAFVAGKRTADV